MTTKAFYAQCRTCRIDWPSYTRAGALILSEHHATQFPGHECTVVERDRGSGGALLLFGLLLVAFVVLGAFLMLRTAAGQTCANNPGICKEIQR